MGEGYCQTEEYAGNYDCTNHIRRMSEMVVGEDWDAAIALDSYPVQNRTEDWPIVNCSDVGAGA